MDQKSIIMYTVNYRLMNYERFFFGLLAEYTDVRKISRILPKPCFSQLVTGEN